MAQGGWLEPERARLPEPDGLLVDLQDGLDEEDIAQLAAETASLATGSSCGGRRWSAPLRR